MMILKVRLVHQALGQINLMMSDRDIITIEPDKRGGKPCIRGIS
ncbi:MAG: DUF433 domain-containing protein [Okeania sp. SIO2C9]|nr:hypothetical protein [Okeania sp. SIO2C9]NEQ77626.1 DUF433 domain-containing protein [Okeania sp. SIO2C9]